MKEPAPNGLPGGTPRPDNPAGEGLTLLEPVPAKWLPPLEEDFPRKAHIGLQLDLFTWFKGAFGAVV